MGPKGGGGGGGGKKGGGPSGAQGEAPKANQGKGGKPPSKGRSHPHHAKDIERSDRHWGSIYAAKPRRPRRQGPRSVKVLIRRLPCLITAEQLQGLVRKICVEVSTQVNQMWA
jgi:hypothetical protein